MDKNSLITAFIALPEIDAIEGKEVTGLIAFCKEEMKKKISKLNGKSESFRVAELEIPQKGCKTTNSGGYLIPNTTKAIIKSCHKVADFIS